MSRRSRIAKSGVALALIVSSAGFYLHTRFQLTATYAVVAGSAISVRAPRDGLLTHDLKLFEIVRAGENLGSVAAAPAIDADLRATTTELQTVQAEVASLKQLIAQGEELQSEAAKRQSILGARRSEHLRHVIEQADADYAAKKAASEGADLVRKRALDLCSQGLLGQQDCEAADTKAQVERSEAQSAEGQVEIAKFLLGSSRAGADIAANAGGEVTYARQRGDDLTLRLATLRQQLATGEARAGALQLRVSPAPTNLGLSTKSRIWAIRQQTGALVAKGDALLDVVNCEQLFVFATLTEERYRKLRIGGAAEVKANGRVFRGRVAQLLGPYGTFTQDRTMQPQPPLIITSVDATAAAVAIEVPEFASLLAPSCEVGTRVEVDFSP